MNFKNFVNASGYVNRMDDDIKVIQLNFSGFSFLNYQSFIQRAKDISTKRHILMKF